MSLTAKDYIDRQLEFVSFNSIGRTRIKVLPFLKGKEWNDVALGFIHSLRPSQVRVVKYSYGITLDSQLWRVTVWLNEDNKTIDFINQEVAVGLPEGCQHAAHLEEMLNVN